MPTQPPLKKQVKAQRLGNRLIAGASWGLFLGLIYCGFAGLVLLTQGFRNVRLEIFGIYLGGGLVGGLLVGALRPWIRSRVTAMTVGVVVMAPLGFGFLLLRNGPIANWDEAQFVALIAGSILLGSMGGKIFWDQHGNSS